MKYSKEVKCKMLNKPVRKKFLTEKRKEDIKLLAILLSFTLSFCALIIIYIIFM